MDNNPPKVSFIPKSSLVRGSASSPFSMSKSILEVLAVVALIGSVGAYAAFYFNNSSIVQEIASKTAEITNIQTKLGQSTEIENAKKFRARTILAQNLLAQHIVVSPVFNFLAQNTVDSVVYDGFAFKRTDNIGTVELTGRAPSYGVLAAQADALRSNVSKELSSFVVTNVTLDPMGTIIFGFTLVFKPDYLLYSNNLESASSAMPVAPASVPLTIKNTTTTSAQKTQSQTTISVPSFPSGVSSPVTEAPLVPAPALAPQAVAPESAPGQSASEWSAVPNSQALNATTTQAPIKKSFWSQFKFW